MARPIIVTGAAGFIGRNTVAELNARGENEIILVDELGKDEKWKDLVGLQYEDIVTPEDFRQATERCVREQAATGEGVILGRGCVAVLPRSS